MKINFLFLLLSSITSVLGQTVSKPVFVSKAPSRVSVDSVYSYTFLAFDSAGRALKYDVREIPSWLTYKKRERRLYGKPVAIGQYPVSIVATNGKKETAQRWMLTVFNKVTKNILTIGNSITNGTDKYNSYRRALWKKLHDAGFNFDMIGSWDRHHMGGDVPDPDFDMDHEGHSGWNSADIMDPPAWDSVRGNIKRWLQTYTPDVVLIELGTNDVFQCRKEDEVIRDLDKLISMLRSKNSQVHIFVSNIIPLGSAWTTKNLCHTKPYGELIGDLNNRLTEWIPRITQPHSPAILVDQFSGLDPNRHMYDDIHPNTEGEEIMAQRWFDAIRPYMILK